MTPKVFFHSFASLLLFHFFAHFFFKRPLKINVVYLIAAPNLHSFSNIHSGLKAYYKGNFMLLPMLGNFDSNSPLN